MPKKDGPDTIEKARKRLVKAQADLQQAQETRARVKLEGEQAIDRARQEASRQLTRATMDVEKRSAAVSEARQALERLRDERALSTDRRAPEGGELQGVGNERHGDPG